MIHYYANIVFANSNIFYIFLSLASQSANNINNADASEDEISNDGASVYSYQSDTLLPDADETVDSNVVEKFEEKLMQAIENASGLTLFIAINM